MCSCTLYTLDCTIGKALLVCTHSSKILWITYWQCTSNQSLPLFPTRWFWTARRGSSMLSNLRLQIKQCLLFALDVSQAFFALLVPTKLRSCLFHKPKPHLALDYHKIQKNSNTQTPSLVPRPFKRRRKGLVHQIPGPLSRACCISFKSRSACAILYQSLHSAKFK